MPQRRLKQKFERTPDTKGRIENKTLTETLEISIAQELLDLCNGELKEAVDAVWQR